MKHNKTKKIIVILASLSVLACALCTTTFASWSVATNGTSGNIPRILDVEMNNNLDVSLDTTFTYESRTYNGQILIENLGNTYFNLANLENSNTHSSEMEYLFAFTNIGTTTNRVGYSFYQSGMLQYDTTKFNEGRTGYSGVATTVYGFPSYTYTDHSIRITALNSGEYFTPASLVGFGNQNIRIYFPHVESYWKLYNEVKGDLSTNEIVKLRVNHRYNISGFDYEEDGTLTRKLKTYTYTHVVELPRYEDLNRAYEPTTQTTMYYITFPAQAPWTSVKAFCEREFDRYNLGYNIYVNNHNVTFSTGEVRQSGDSYVIQPDVANTLLSITDNNAYAGASIPDRTTPYIGALATEHIQAIEDVDFGTWIGTAVQGFFDIEILPSFTFLDIFVSGISVLLLVAFLKMFAGG